MCRPLRHRAQRGWLLSKHLACLPADGAFLDAAGHLIDRWGPPYFFHALSGSEMEILSAGPDREFHTADDARGDDF